MRVWAQVRWLININSDLSFWHHACTDSKVSMDTFPFDSMNTPMFLLSASSIVQDVTNTSNEMLQGSFAGQDMTVFLPWWLALSSENERWRKLIILFSHNTSCQFFFSKHDVSARLPQPFSSIVFTQQELTLWRKFFLFRLLFSFSLFLERGWTTPGSSARPGRSVERAKQASIRSPTGKNSFDRK